MDKLTFNIVLSWISICISFIFAFACSCLLTKRTHCYALKNAILDLPNERSSHNIPVPRGGGVAIVLTFNLFLLLFLCFTSFDHHLLTGLSIGGIIIAGIGYYDDIYSISATKRFLLHLIAASWAVHWLGVFTFFSWYWLNYLLTVTGIIWCINFYNFMDGIDGIAGTEGIFVSLSSGIVLWILGFFSPALILMILSFTILGFTVWNWPPAKIFLGDVGSGFLGYLFGVFSLYTINKHMLSMSVWVILLAIFLCDSSLTLLQRILQGKKWYQAHREHAYQQLILYGCTHKQITLGVLFINLNLLPLVGLSIYYPNHAVHFAIIAIALLSLIWAMIKIKCHPNSGISIINH